MPSFKDFLSQPSSAVNTAPADPSDGQAATNTLNAACNAWLESKFAAQKQELTDRSTGYESAYRRAWCERVIVDCCRSIGIHFNPNRITSGPTIVLPSGISFTISVEQVTRFFGIPFGTFKGIRGDMKAVRTAHTSLRAKQIELGSQRPPATLSAKMQDNLTIFSMMLREGPPLRKLEDIPDAERESKEARIVSMKLVRLNKLVAECMPGLVPDTKSEDDTANETE